MKGIPTDEGLITLSFISLKDNVYLEAGSGPILQEFLSLFERAVNLGAQNYAHVQQNTVELRENVYSFLNQYGRKYPDLFILRRFVDLVPLNQYFLIVSGKVADTACLLGYFNYLANLHNRNGEPQLISECWSHLGRTFENYNLNCYGHQKKDIGRTLDKNDRVCRFCGTANRRLNKFGKTVTFKSKSHAFSEALGNKNVITFDECDHCNGRFSRGIEPSLINFLQVFRSLYGLRGKRGVKKTKGHNFELDPLEGLHFQYDGIIDPEAPLSSLEASLAMKETFIPQDIYRCLVKFSLSVTDAEECLLFKKTIDWINGEFNATKLPLVSFVQHAAFFKEHPMLFSYRKKSKSNFPYGVGEFHYADMIFVYIIPFSCQDTIDYTSSEECDAYWKEFNQFRTSYGWKAWDLSPVEPVKTIINLKIDGIEIGKNTFISTTDSNSVDY